MLQFVARLLARTKVRRAQAIAVDAADKFDLTIARRAQRTSHSYWTSSQQLGKLRADRSFDRLFLLL